MNCKLFFQVIYTDKMTLPILEILFMILLRDVNYRAVGKALSKNPVQFIIPCHRVICANGHHGGYQASYQIKHWLLQHEHL